ncbi:DUF4326 domain-containing protein [Actinoplanes subtropicus]|uniref:DUF4326 domain-containing protein n=1 Tax=Actinoplanes subtropicus TaxID=543632 RepID=UPI000AFA6814|nr:DUF4326 domain-containing protein [Actinoplanes subtropicus]
MNIRLMGDGDQVAAAVALLETLPGLHVTNVSRPYTARGGDGRMRIYLDAEITLSPAAPVTAARIQRRRSAGWRMPAGTVYVGRPTRFGNPFPAGYFGREQAVQLYREWLAGADHLGYTDADQRRRAILDGLPDLAGRDLACWCPPGEACHADVLLDLANAGVSGGPLAA